MTSIKMITDKIRSYPCPECYLCGSEGEYIYVRLKDRLFGAPGEWNLKKCSNPECGLVWLDPMPQEGDISKAYRKYYTHQHTVYNPERQSFFATWLRHGYRLVKEGYLAYKYDYQRESLITWQKLLGMLIYLHLGRRAALDFSIMYLPARISGHLLDVGCGSGQLLELMQKLSWQVEGVDFDYIAVESARRKGLQVSLGTLETQKYPNDHFDAITMSHLIEHIYDPLKTLRECHRILKPGGYLVIVTPNGKSWGHKLFRDAWLHLDPPRHVHIFTSLSLCSLAERAGFLNLKVKTTIRDANTLFMASRAIQRTGKYIWGSFQPRAIQTWAQRMQLIEWALLKVKPDIGEEIVLMGEK